TNVKKIKKILPWGSIRSGGGAKKSLKMHTYMIIKNKIFDTICHEHLGFFSSKVIIEMVKKIGLKGNL
ncbi:hypothetical protein, partial [Desulfobacula sp.]|uniref:hypothetical protein n=1 Tax=Desulfobacula sp. TaxID=2593537 RepID=UPI0039B9BFA8